MAAHPCDLMCHKQETAANVYRVVNRAHTSVRASVALSQLMHGASSSISTIPIETESVYNVVMESSIVQQPDSINNIMSQSGTEVQMDHQKLFTKPQIQKLVILCDDIIKGGPINAQRIREALNASSDGKNMLDVFTSQQLVMRSTHQRNQKKGCLFPKLSCSDVLLPI
jgi:BarA-like signal transduction histidine kinase